MVVVPHCRAPARGTARQRPCMLPPRCRRRRARMYAGTLAGMSPGSCCQRPPGLPRPWQQAGGSGRTGRDSRPCRRPLAAGSARAPKSGGRVHSCFCFEPRACLGCAKRRPAHKSVRSCYGQRGCSARMNWREGESARSVAPHRMQLTLSRTPIGDAEAGPRTGRWAPPAAGPAGTACCPGTTIATPQVLCEPQARPAQARTWCAADAPALLPLQSRAPPQQQARE